MNPNHHQLLSETIDKAVRQAFKCRIKKYLNKNRDKTLQINPL